MRWRPPDALCLCRNIGLSTNDEAEPPIPSFQDENHDGNNDEAEVAIMERGRWETRPIRGHFESTMNSSTVEANNLPLAMNDRQQQSGT